MAPVERVFLAPLRDSPGIVTVILMAPPSTLDPSVNACARGWVWMESRVELFARIRRDARVEGLSVRALAARHGVHRTNGQALESAAPRERRPRQGVSWRLEPFKAAIDAMLTKDTMTPRKQRHTARRILARLVEEHGAEELLYSTVRD